MQWKKSWSSAVWEKRRQRGRWLALATPAEISPKEKRTERRKKKSKKKKKWRKCVSDTDLSCFPGSCSWILQRSAALISSSFFRISLCSPDTQSWATVALTFWRSQAAITRLTRKFYTKIFFFFSRRKGGIEMTMQLNKRATQFHENLCITSTVLFCINMALWRSWIQENVSFTFLFSLEICKSNIFFCEG